MSNFLIIFTITIYLTFISGLSERPIIGILSQESYIVSHLFDEKPDSFIAASYVKYLESAGARVIPIWIGQNVEYYERVVNYTNGILFPGGGVYFNETGGYGEAAKEIYRLAIEANKNGIYFPIWGTCLGLQVIPYAILDRDIRINCSLKKVAIPLNFGDDFQNSKMFSNASADIIDILKNRNTTFNYHRYCLTENVLKENNILDDWHILSTNVDVNNIQFISAIESKKYPVYGIQFHPEKNSYEFRTNYGIPHCLEAQKVTQYFANFFVTESKKNINSFPSDEMEKDTLIYNYIPTYTGKKNQSSYEQIYTFSQTDFKKQQLL